MSMQIHCSNNHRVIKALAGETKAFPDASGPASPASPPLGGRGLGLSGDANLGAHPLSLGRARPLL